MRDRIAADRRLLADERPDALMERCIGAGLTVSAPPSTDYRRTDRDRTA